MTVGESEETSLHSVIKHDECNGREAVEVAHDSIFIRREKIDVKRDENPVEESAHDAAQSIYGSIFC